MCECGCGMRDKKYWFPGPSESYYVLTLSVACVDCDSPPGVTIELIEPGTPMFDIYKQEEFRDWLGWYTGELVIVAPDKGALDRAAAIRNLTGGELIHSDKVRDPESGRITGMKLVTGNVRLKGQRVLVVDDLCDGGATFAALGDLLRGAEVKSLALFVAHGIFSRGLATLRAYDHVGTTDSFYHADRNLNVKMFPAFPDEEIK